MRSFFLLLFLLTANGLFAENPDITVSDARKILFAKGTDSLKQADALDAPSITVIESDPVDRPDDNLFILFSSKIFFRSKSKISERLLIVYGAVPFSIMTHPGIPILTFYISSLCPCV